MFLLCSEQRGSAAMPHLQPQFGNAHGRLVFTPALAQSIKMPIMSVKFLAFPFWLISVRHSTK